MDQIDRLKRLVTFTGELSVGNAPQFLVDERDEGLERGTIANVLKREGIEWQPSEGWMMQIPRRLTAGYAKRR